MTNDGTKRDRQSTNINNITPIHRWETHTFPWGSAVKEQRTGKWTNVYLMPDGQEINVEHLNVIIHHNGIEFVTE